MFIFLLLSFLGCGSVVNNTLKSPGYPNKYPADIKCIYLVPIPDGLTMKISLEEFYLEHDRVCRSVDIVAK